MLGGTIPRGYLCTHVHGADIVFCSVISCYVICYLTVQERCNPHTYEILHVVYKHDM